MDDMLTEIMEMMKHQQETMMALNQRQSVLEAVLVTRLTLESVQGRIGAMKTRPSDEDFAMLDAATQAYEAAAKQLIEMAVAAKHAAKKMQEEGPSRIVIGRG